MVGTARRAVQPWVGGIPWVGPALRAGRRHHDAKADGPFGERALPTERAVPTERPYPRRDRIAPVSLIPTTPRLLLGPGPSPVLPRVLEAMTAPQRSHLDPDMIALLDDVRRRLHGLFNVNA